MTYVAPVLGVTGWLRSRLAPAQRLIECGALLIPMLALAAVSVPIWLALAYRPDRDDPVNRLIEACQLGTRRGSMAIIGLAAAVLTMTWGAAFLARLAWRLYHDTKAMRKLGRVLAGVTRETSFLAGGNETAVRILPDRAAFTAGLFRPRIYLGADLLGALDAREREAVLLHECHHRRRYDPLRCWLVDLALGSFCFRPGRAFAAYYRAAREAEADRDAVERLGDDRPLLLALTKADRLQQTAGACGLSSERRSALRQMRHMEADLTRSDTLSMAIGLFIVVGLLITATAGLSDWQPYWYCPTGHTLR